MYKTLSKYYDIFMQDVDYDKWINYVCGFILNRKNGVDLGCGSGKFTLGLLKKGYEVYGVDISTEMLSHAVKNSKKLGINANFILGNMENFVFLKKAEFVTAMCDAVNYLKNPAVAFKNIYENLSQSGVFIFDISTAYKLTQILGNNTYSDNINDITYIWNNFLNTKQSKVDMELTFFEKQGSYYAKHTEKQTQYIHSISNILQLLSDAGFKKTNAYSMMTKKKASENDERVHFVAYK